MSADVIDGLAILRLEPDEVRWRAHELADILIDAVEGGASVSFLPPLAPLAAVRWVLDVADRMRRQSHLFAAELGGQLVGTVQLVRADAPNQPHRAEVRNLIVHRAARGRGVARALLSELEKHARLHGISLLTLDVAARGDAPAVYEHLGFTRAGTIPGYALDVEGRPVDMIWYYKVLA